MNQKPTESELNILQILWKEGPSTVREVNDIINQKRDTGYTTTLKIMQIMFEKDLVKRRKNGKQHVYQAIVEQEATQQVLLDQFLKNAFGGSAMKLVMQTLGNRKASQEDIEKIRELLDKMEGGTK